MPTGAISDNGDDDDDDDEKEKVEEEIQPSLISRLFLTTFLW